MRVLAFAFALLLVTYNCTSAQSVDAEIARLREILNVPPSTPIVPSKSPLPEVSPIKVFIAVGQDQKIHNAFTKRMNEWSKKDGLKYGVIEIVSNVSDADVILARYAVRLNDVSPPSYTAPLIPMRSYSYLIIRKPDKLEMLWRMVLEGYYDVTDTERVGDVLRKEFFKRMKARSKK